MAKSRFVRLGVLLFVCIHIWAVPVQAEKGEQTDSFQLGQVAVELPKIQVYYHTDGTLPEADQITAYLDKEKLEVKESRVCQPDKDSLSYYVLLDVSASIPDGYFEDMKQAILAMKQQLGSNEKLYLLTFGDRVELALDGGENARQAEVILNALSNQDQETHLFDAISKVTELAEKEDVFTQKALIAFTDGEDCAVGGETQKESATLLQKKGLPLYGMVMKETNTKNINAFGTFARSTNGTLGVIGQGEAGEKLNQLQSWLQSSNVMVLKKADNLVTKEKQSLILDVKPLGVNQNMPIYPVKWVPDTKIPVVQKVKRISDTKLAVIFSENVMGYENKGSFVLHNQEDQKDYVAESVSYNSKSHKAELLFGNPIYQGSYQLKCHDIYDVSMEKNAVAEDFALELQDGPKESLAIVRFLQVYWWVFLILLVMVVLFFLFYWRIKRNKGLVVVEDKVSLLSNVDVKKRVILQKEQMPGRKLQFIVQQGPGRTKRLDVELHSSLIVGRAASNEVSFDDHQMSRQHFVLEAEGDYILISDLQTTNGTMVNGVKLQSKQKLSSGDRVEAGSVSMLITW